MSKFRELDPAAVKQGRDILQRYIAKREAKMNDQQDQFGTGSLDDDVKIAEQLTILDTARSRAVSRLSQLNDVARAYNHAEENNATIARAEEQIGILSSNSRVPESLIQRRRDEIEVLKRGDEQVQRGNALIERTRVSFEEYIAKKNAASFQPATPPHHEPQVRVGERKEPRREVPAAAERHEEGQRESPVFEGAHRQEASPAITVNSLHVEAMLWAVKAEPNIYDTLELRDDEEDVRASINTILDQATPGIRLTGNHVRGIIIALNNSAAIYHQEPVRRRKLLGQQDENVGKVVSWLFEEHPDSVRAFCDVLLRRYGEQLRLQESQQFSTTLQVLDERIAKKQLVTNAEDIDAGEVTLEEPEVISPPPQEIRVDKVEQIVDSSTDELDIQAFPGKAETIQPATPQPEGREKKEKQPKPALSDIERADPEIHENVTTIVSNIEREITEKLKVDHYDIAVPMKQGRVTMLFPKIRNSFIENAFQRRHITHMYEITVGNLGVLLYSHQYNRQLRSKLYDEVRELIISEIRQRMEAEENSETTPAFHWKETNK